MADAASVTSGVVKDFLASRPRRRPRSYNHLLGVARRLFDWMVDQELLVVSPLRLRPRRETARRIPYIFDLPQACRRRAASLATATSEEECCEADTCSGRAAKVLQGLQMKDGMGARSGEGGKMCWREARLTRHEGGARVLRGRAGECRNRREQARAQTTMQRHTRRPLRAPMLRRDAGYALRVRT